MPAFFCSCWALGSIFRAVLALSIGTSQVAACRDAAASSCCITALWSAAAHRNGRGRQGWRARLLGGVWCCVGAAAQDARRAGCVELR